MNTERSWKRVVGAWVSGSSRARVVLVCGLLVGVSVLPVAQSHTWVTNGGNPNGSPTSFGRHGLGLPHNDPCRYYEPKIAQDPATCNNHAGISGSYVGSAGAWLVNITNTGWKNSAPGGGDDVLFGFLLAFCDLEILSDGNPATVGDNALDEMNVDGVLTTGTISDGLIDDGGTGGACHTSGHYLGPYNSPGCGTGVHALAHVSDAVVGDEVEIVAGCGWKSTAGTGGLLTYTTCVINTPISTPMSEFEAAKDDAVEGVLGLALTPVNTVVELITNGPVAAGETLVMGVVDGTGKLIEAGAHFVKGCKGLLGKLFGCSTDACEGEFVSCGSQGAADAAKFGGTVQDPTFWGGTGGHWPNAGIPFPSAALIAADGCLQSDSSSVVWAVNAATTGWIHSTGTSLEPFPADDK